MTEISVNFPGFPPSTNELYVNAGRRRVKSKKYRTWLDGAALFIRGEASLQGSRITEGPFAVDIEVYGMSRRRDLDNIVKPILDAIVASGATPDDRYLDHLLVRRISSPFRQVIVTISPIR